MPSWHECGVDELDPHAEARPELALDLVEHELVVALSGNRLRGACQ
jgi:hypothetical protein